MKDNNTLKAYHIRSKKGEPLKVDTKKYTWHIPKHLRSLNIQPGDIVGVRRTQAPILVVEVFREDVEDTGKNHKSVSGIFERAPKQD